MYSLLVILAAGLSPPQIDESFARRMQNYYPQWALSEHAQSTLDADLTVTPSGIVAICNVVEAFGNKRLAAEICAATVGLKLTPATDAEGIPTHGILRTRFNNRLTAYFLKTMADVPEKPDITIIVSKLPAGEDEIRLSLSLLISAAGKSIDCRDTLNPKNISASYVSVACNQATAAPTVALRTASGEAVPYVKNLRVSFRRQASP